MCTAEGARMPNYATGLARFEEVVACGFLNMFSRSVVIVAGEYIRLSLLRRLYT